MERHDGLRYRWFLDPLYGRGYPAPTLALVGDARRTVLPGDLEAIAAPTDFLGVNYYFPETIADDPTTPRWAHGAAAGGGRDHGDGLAGRAARACPNCWRGSSATTIRARST
jgi:beta-glucosidase/6-phospho-beta-glucosidase/beta-galactosidase